MTEILSSIAMRVNADDWEEQHCLMEVTLWETQLILILLKDWFAFTENPKWKVMWIPKKISMAQLMACGIKTVKN